MLTGKLARYSETAVCSPVFVHMWITEKPRGALSRWYHCLLKILKTSAVRRNSWPCLMGGSPAWSFLRMLVFRVETPGGGEACAAGVRALCFRQGAPGWVATAGSRRWSNQAAPPSDVENVAASGCWGFCHLSPHQHRPGLCASQPLPAMLAIRPRC